MQKERVFDAKGLRVNDETQAANKKHSCQRDQKWRQFKPLNEAAHAAAKQRSDQESQWHGQPRIQTPLANHRGNKNTGERDNRADGQVDAAGKNHERGANGGNTEESV